MRKSVADMTPKTAQQAAHKKAELKPGQRRLPIPLMTGMKRYGLALAVLWTLIVAVSMTWNGVSQWRAMHEVAANGTR
ncbi:MAG: hypothetical protein U9P80_09890, partial [Thermodesulfobacteriota bacterium]|nr:hypothetical protein [Thermodesulfobacteriota bacterium]